MSKTVLFQAIQFNRSTHSSTRLIDRTLSGATTLGQMAMKEYSTFLKAPALLASHHQDCLVLYQVFLSKYQQFSHSR